MKPFWILLIFFAFPFFCYCDSRAYSDLDEYLSRNRADITEGHIGAPCHREFFKELFEKNPWIRSVAETGFNAGHSAEMFLSDNANTDVTSFDIGLHRYVRKGFAYLTLTYPGRLNLIIGDSKKTVPEYVSKNPHAKFDLIFVDGGHDRQTALADILNMGKMAHRNTLLVVDDLENIGEVREAWNEAVRRGVIQVIQTYQFPNSPGWGLAKYNL